MGNNVKYLLVVLNVCAALAVLPASAFVHRLYQSPAMNMYAELDRAGAIDWDRVASAFSEQARDDRGYLPRLFFRGHRAVRWLSVPCILGFVANALLILIFWPSAPALKTPPPLPPSAHASGDPTP